MQQKPLLSEASTWRNAIDGIGDPLCILSTAGTIMFGNKAFLRMTGVQEVEIAGKELYEVIKGAGITSDAEDSNLRVTHNNKVYIAGASPVINDNGTLIGETIAFHDISHQSEYERAAAKTEAAAQWLISEARNPVFALENDKVVFANTAALVFFEKTKIGTLFKTPLLTLFDDTCHEFVKKNILNGSADETPIEGEIRLKQSGRTKYVEVRSILSLPGGINGAPDFKYVILGDVTQIKLQQDEILRAHTRLMAILNSLPANVMVLDATTNAVLYSNKSNHPTLHSLVGEHDQRRGRHANESLVSHLIEADGRPIAEEVEWETFDSKSGKWYTVAERAITWVGGDNARLIIAADITELRALAETLSQKNLEYAHLFDAAPIGIAKLNQAGEITQANAAFGDIWGLSSQDVIGSKLPVEFAFASAEDYTALRNKMVTVKFGLKIEGEEFEIIKRDGQSAYIILYASPLHDGNGNSLGSLVIIDDITEQKRFSHENIEMKKKIADANRMASIGLLASSIAHEINNPNQYILSAAQTVKSMTDTMYSAYIEKLEKSGISEIGKMPLSRVKVLMPQLLDAIEDGSKRIDSIITSLRALAKGGSDAASLYNMISVSDALAGAIKFLMPEIKRMTNRYEIDIAKDMPLVRGDTTQIQQVATNLVINALQALPDKDAGVSLKAYYDKDEEAVKVVIRDDGNGFPQEMIEKISSKEPFMTTKLDGMGLGLYITQTIIDRHHGRLLIDSKPGAGTTITVSLPARGGGAWQ